MAKTITIPYKDREYVLEYSRETIEIMEKQGFNISAIEDKPMTILPMLFEGAFLKNHRFVKKEVIREIFAMMGNKMDLVQRLAIMYNEPIEAMLDEPDEAKKVTWEANW